MTKPQAPRGFYVVMRLHQLVAECLEHALLPLGVTAAQYTVLSLVQRHAPITSAELARRLRISAQSAGESVKALESRKLIERNGIEENKRVLVLKLTAQGNRLLARAHSMVDQAEQAFFRSLSPAEQAAFTDSIDRLRTPAARR